MRAVTSLCLILGALPAIVAGDTRPPWPLDAVPLAEYEPVCFAAYSERSDTWLVHNLAQCQQPLSPCSTFKIPNALIGLETGVLAGPGHTFTWDGTRHDRVVLNRDHDLASAIENSVVWYFQDVARLIGPERMQTAIDAFDYGNRDISGGIDRFWLGSSLEITAFQQVQFLRRLSRQELKAASAHQETVKRLLLQHAALPPDFRGTLYGKTGSCPMPGDDHGWFVGLLERDGDTVTFAVNVIGEDRWGPDARAIAIRALQSLP